MNLTPAVIVDIALIAVVVCTVLYYAHKGFVAGLISLVGNLVSLVLAWIVSGRVSPVVFENFFREGLVEQTADMIAQQGVSGLEAMLDNLSGLLPQSVGEQLAASLQGLLGSGAPDLAAQIVDSIITPLAVPLISVVVFFATFALCKLLVALLTAVLTNVNRLPLVGTVNRSLGVVIGLVAGVINAVLILCLLWAVIAITNNSLPALNDSAMAGSYLYRFFSAYNPFV